MTRPCQGVAQGDEQLHSGGPRIGTEAHGGFERGDRFIGATELQERATERKRDAASIGVRAGGGRGSDTEVNRCSKAPVFESALGVGGRGARS